MAHDTTGMQRHAIQSLFSVSLSNVLRKPVQSMLARAVRDRHAVRHVRGHGRDIDDLAALALRLDHQGDQSLHGVHRPNVVEVEQLRMLLRIGFVEAVETLVGAEAAGVVDEAIEAALEFVLDDVAELLESLELGGVGWESADGDGGAVALGDVLEV